LGIKKDKFKTFVGYDIRGPKPNETSFLRNKLMQSRSSKHIFGTSFPENDPEKPIR